MKKEQNFDTIWREKFSPQLVYVPQDLYKEYLPIVDVIPYPVYDENVIDIDFKFQDTISDSFHRICKAATRIYPYIYVPTIKQLIDQLAAILSGEQNEIYVIGYHRLIKSIPIDDLLLQDCRKIQMVILEEAIVI